jgi:hypothetical protein
LDGFGESKGETMYHWVEDKDYLKRAYSVCADIVNQLVQELKKNDIEARMFVVGSKKRNMITQNAKEKIDFDFNLLIDNANSFRECDLKEKVRKLFNLVLSKNGWGDCFDSTSVLTTEERVFNKGNKTPFSIDVCIVKIENGQIHRLIHNKTGFVALDQYYWNMVPNSKDLQKKEEFLKPKYWLEVRETYLNKKNMYLTRNDYDHPSFVCYIEAVNEVYAKKKGKNEWMNHI